MRTKFDGSQRAVGRALTALCLGVAAVHSAHADITTTYVKRGIEARAATREMAPNCSPCGEDQEPWLYKGPINGDELNGYDARTGDYGTNDLTSGNQSLSFQADYRGMHAEVSTARKVDFLSPDAIHVDVTGRLEVRHPGGADLLRDRGMASGAGQSFTEFGFTVDRPTTVLVTVDMSFKDLVEPAGALEGGLAGRFIFEGENLTRSFTAADFAKGPQSFVALLAPNHGAGVTFEVGGSRVAQAAGHGVAEWQGSVSIQAVPEPSGWALLSCCLLAGGWIVRRDQRLRGERQVD